MGTTDKIVLRLEHRLPAAPERVFDAWLTPEMIGRWMFGPALREEEIVRLSLDPRMGGRFSFEVRRHGRARQHVGRYLQMNRPRRLIFTWGVAGESEEASRVIVDLMPAGTGCDLLLTQELPAHWAPHAERVHAEWEHMLASLTRSLTEQAA